MLQASVADIPEGLAVRAGGAPPGLPTSRSPSPRSPSSSSLVLGVVAVIAGDLIAAGLLDVHHTDPVEIELDMLTKMIERVRAI